MLLSHVKDKEQPPFFLKNFKSLFIHFEKPDSLEMQTRSKEVSVFITRLD